MKPPKKRKPTSFVARFVVTGTIGMNVTQLLYPPHDDNKGVPFLPAPVLKLGELSSGTSSSSAMTVIERKSQ
jgi:hypothetical protein